MLPDVMRGRSKLTPEAAEIEYLPSDDARPLDLGEVFPTKAPLELDLGCGDGSFLAALAAQHPERNFLGIERLLGRVCTACGKIATRGLTNARIVRVDIGSAVSGLVPAASVQVCHVMFPDPWPKRRHHRRRTVTAEFLKGIARILAPEGVVRLTTDDAPYFEQMRQAAASVPELIESPTGDDVPLPRSTFEQRFVELGLPVYRLVLRKVSPER